MSESRLIIRGLPEDWKFPSTRYRGSKRKMLKTLWQQLRGLEFDNALDLFGGTATVSLLLKWMGKKVTFNDYLQFNSMCAYALLRNNTSKLSDADLEFLLSGADKAGDGGFIANTFKGKYFLDAENAWLDGMVGEISGLAARYRGRELREKRALATFSLGQACLIKRPFNLFHRANLGLRTSDTQRRFGNKTTWEIPFPEAFVRFAFEANSVVFDSGRSHEVMNNNAFEVDQRSYDLVYMDPPYFFPNQKDSDYRRIYHFLEGLVRYDEWPNMIDYDTRTLRMVENGSNWPHRSAAELRTLFSRLIAKFKTSILVISHRSGSLVDTNFLVNELRKQGKSVRKVGVPYKYALRKSNGDDSDLIEWILIGS